jgi:UDP-GlcNAc:undecaprenyl-phosphate GlcNAc-1-phosphate transferase
MSVGLTAASSFTTAAVASVIATPVAIKVAARIDFLDRPRGYRQHLRPTPLLGGAAVVAAFLLAALVVAGASGRLLVLLGCSAGMWALGTLDDRFGITPKWRLLAEAGAAAALVAAGLGWDTSLQGFADFLLTVGSVVIAVNAFNLMDNLDGACGSVTAVAAAGAGVLAAIKGEVTIAAVAFALSGACAGFLPFNLASPARIFLGDGGSMPAGFLIAALVMATAWHGRGGDPALVVGALLAGLPIFDAALVTFSRVRRGESVMTGGRDHLTHRLLLYLRGPRAVGLALATVQALLCALAILGYEAGSTAVTWLGLGVFLSGIIAIVALDTGRWRPESVAAESVMPAPGDPVVEPVSVDYN